MLAWDWISFNDFYRHNKKFTGLDLNTGKLCLSLDENNRSKKIKSTLDQGEFNIFTGLRHNISWKGCGLSYMYIARRALDKGIKSLTICEDDVTFNEELRTNYQTILRYLNQNKNKWHLFSGLCAQVHKDTKILKIEKFEDIEFIYIDKIVSTVFNIYSTEMLERLSEWDYKNASRLQQIDRYVESMNDLVAVITVPFLVGHDSKQKSTLWNFDNIEYDNMITESQNLLRSKIDEFKQGTKI
jgi:predicted nucleotide-binding protein (sugar kinase/HSP70/actin superfamily)